MTDISPLIRGLALYTPDIDKENGSDNSAPLLSEDTHPMTEKAAGLYEKLRNALDYSEHNQIQRRAIERLLKRRIIFELDKNIGKELLEELIIAGYIKSSSATIGQAGTIDGIVKKYTTLYERSVGFDNGNKFKQWTRSMAAIEIYRSLFPNVFDKKVLEVWTEILKSITVVDTSISKERYLRALDFAAARSLLEQSDPELHFALFEKTFPSWFRISDDVDLEDQLDQLKNEIVQFSQKIDEELSDPLVWHITRKIKNSRIAISIIKEIVERYGRDSETIFLDENKIGDEVKKIIEPKYAKLLKAIKENGRRALLYIFCTKIVIALLVEVPFDRFFTGQVDYFALAFNIIVPPLLLWIIVSWSFKLDRANTLRIITSVKDMVKDQNKKIVLTSGDGQAQVSLGTIAFNGFFYAVTFGLIVGLLVAFNFHFVSIFLFLMFLALVCYFGNRVRLSASRWQNTEYRKNFLSMVGTLLVFPVVRLGRWLSESFSSVNFFVFFMDMIIETPFRLVLAEFNAFMNFVRDKAEDVL